MQITMQCWNCHDWFDVLLDACDKCGEPWDGFYKPDTSSPCWECGADTPHETDDPGPILCRPCVDRITEECRRAWDEIDERIATGG